MLLSRGRLCAAVARCREYSQTAAAAVSGDATDEMRPRVKKPASFAKSLYVGNFLGDVFAKRAERAAAPKLDGGGGGLYAVSIPREYGGLGLSAAAASQAYRAAGFGEFRDAAAHGSVAKCIATAGTDEQKARYLPRMASGERVATFCVYEREHGYDVQNTGTKASRADGGKWVIDGGKQWVTNGRRADVFLVLARTMDECNRPEGGETFFTAFLVDKNSAGLRVADDGGGGGHSEVTFDRVVADCALGPENEGLTFYTMLFHGDLVESASATLGELDRIVRSVSGGGLEDRSSLIRLGTLNGHLYAMDCVLGFANTILDAHDRHSDYEPILARLFVNETAYGCLKLLNDLGASGKSLNRVGNSLLFDGRANLLTYVGALLGIQHAGQFMAEDVRQLRNPLMFPKYTVAHILRIQRLLKDNPKLSGKLERYLHPSLKKQASDLEYCLCKFQFGVQHMFVNLGPDTYLFQMILERANSVAMSLFAMAAVLHRVSHRLSSDSNAHQRYPTELLFANVFCNNARERCRILVDEILNSPHNVVDPHYKALGKNCFRETNYFLEHPLKRNIY